MKTKLSETLKEHGIGLTFPIEIKNSDGQYTYFEVSEGYWHKREYDANGNEVYFETSNDFWIKRQYDAEGNETYFEDSNGYWSKSEFDADGNETYFENSNGVKRGVPKDQSCDGKVIEVDGKKYKLQEL